MADVEAAPVLAAKPDHVPDELVYRFDYNRDPEFARAPHERAAALLADAPPIFWTPYNGGHWVVLRHRIGIDVLRDPARLSSQFISREDYKAMMESWPEEQRGAMAIPITIDPPDHTRLRAPLSAAFSPVAVKAMKADIERLAARLVDRVAPAGGCDFTREIAEVFPVEVFLKMFGLPVDHEREYRDLAKSQLETISFDMGESARRNRRIADVMRSTLLARRDDPQDDLISRIWQFDIEGEPMTLELMESYCVVLFLGGLDTVVNALGFGVRHLAEHAELQERLRAEPEAIPNASEDLLRRYAIVSPVRHATRDQELHGVKLRERDLVMVFTPSTGIDADAFPDPDRLRIDKRNSSHLTFGGGPHYCLGTHLARLELNAMYEAVVTRLPTFRLDPDDPPAFRGGIITGPTRLPIRWD